jgi:hypothetical protein
MLMTQEIVDQDTIHHLFPGLNKLLDFQRKFSIELEQQYELPWEQQRWGRCFSSNVSYLFPIHLILGQNSSTVSSVNYGITSFSRRHRYLNPLLPLPSAFSITDS